MKTTLAPWSTVILTALLAASAHAGRQQPTSQGPHGTRNHSTKVPKELNDEIVRLVDAGQSGPLRAFLRKHGLGELNVGEYGAKELCDAATAGDLKTVTRLLDSGYNVNARILQIWGTAVSWHRNALTQAARGGHYEVAKLLIERGADPNLLPGAKSAAYRALVSYSANSGKILRLLVEHGVDLSPPRVTKGRLSKKELARLGLLVAAAIPGRDAKDHDPESAAIKVRLLLEAGHDVDSKGRVGGYPPLTPLSAVVAEGRFQGRQSQLNVIRELLRHKPEVNWQDDNGKTALHYAVINRDADVIDLLIQAGADKTVADKRGRTPVSLAQQVYPRHDVLEALGLPSTPVPEGTIRPHIHATRVTGVAPLHVFFDAVGTDGLRDDDYLNACFDWHFDTTGVDPTHPRRTGIGFNVGHVFREPGTYTVNMTVRDTAGKTAQKDIAIEVLPFTGKTYYVAAVGNDTNDGSLEKPLRSVDAAIERAEPNTRILFRQGDRWESEGLLLKGKSGPVIIGAYTDPTCTSDELPQIHGRSFARLTDVADWRFMDLNIVGMVNSRDQENAGNGISVHGSARDLLFYRMDVSRFGHACFILFGAENTAIAECTIHDTGAYATFAADCRRLTWIGNSIRNLHDFEHGLRTQSGKKIYFAYCRIEKDIGCSKTAMTMRANTSQIVMARNRIGGGWSFSLAVPGSVAFPHHNLADQNVLTAGGSFDAQNITLRRNRMFYVPNKGRKRVSAKPMLAKFGTHMESTGVCENIKIHNNVWVSPGPLLMGDVNGVEVLNNILLVDTKADSIRGLYGRATSVVSDRNLIYAKDLQSGKAADVSAYLNRMRADGHDRDSIVAEPLFESLDPDSPDFLRLKKESPGRDILGIGE